MTNARARLAAAGLSLAAAGLSPAAGLSLSPAAGLSLSLFGLASPALGAQGGKAAPKPTAKAAQKPAAKAPTVKIGAMTARLFYEATGRFSEDVLSDPNASLWNTIIGEGSSGGASTSTLVTVEVRGPAGEFVEGRSVELTATAAGKPMLKKSVPVNLFTNEGKLYVGFWLYGTGCEHVALTARVLGQGTPSSLSKTIKFDCGE